MLLEPELPHSSSMRLNLKPAGLKGHATSVGSLNPWKGDLTKSQTFPKYFEAPIDILHILCYGVDGLALRALHASLCP